MMISSRPLAAAADDRTRPRVLAMIAFVGLTAVGCGAPAPNEPQPAPGPPAVATTVTTAETTPAVTPSPPSTVDPAPVTAGTPPAIVDPAIVRAAERARGTAEGEQAAAATLKAGGTRDALWGAVYVYSVDGDDPALLAPVLTHADASLRVLAAGGLLRMGDKSGFVTLIAETGNTAILAGSEPPQPIGEVAAIMLAMASGAPHDISPGPATRQAWREWYAANGDRLGFTPGLGWSVR